MTTLVPRTAIDDYTLVLAFATVGLLLITWRLAKSGRDTVRAFVDVERADIVITLERFRVENRGGTYNVATSTVEGGDALLAFDVIANNLGRSSALITHVSHGWFEESQIEGGIFMGPPKTYIVKAGGATILDLSSTKLFDDLKRARFLWLLIAFKSPLHKKERVIRTCFEVFGVNSNVPACERKREEWDKDQLAKSGTSKLRRLWKLFGGR